MAHLDDIVVTHDDSKGHLTFGIELEFLQPVLFGDKTDRYPDFRPVFRTDDWNDVLDPKGTDDFLVQHLGDLEGITVRDEAGDEFVPPHDNVPKYDAWRIIGDSSVRKTEDEKYRGYDWIGKEVTSEVLNAYEGESFVKVRRFCRGMRKLRVHINETAGLHVHIGRGDDGFSLRTMKRFSSVAWVIDEVLLDMQHPSRRQSAYCKTLAKTSELTNFRPEDETTFDMIRDPIIREEAEAWVPDEGISDDLKKKLIRIWSTTSLKELADLMGAPSHPWATNQMRAATRGTFGFRRFLPAGKTGGNTNTIEFRQMIGSFDHKHINHWVRLCALLVDFSRFSTVEAFQRIIMRASNEEMYNHVDLLTDLDQAETIPFWQAKVDDYAKPNPEVFQGSNRHMWLRPLRHADR